MHRFLGFLRPLARPYAPFLSGPGDRYMSVTWPLQSTGPLEGRDGRSVGPKMCWKGYRSRLEAGRSELASHSLPGSATQEQRPVHGQCSLIQSNDTKKLSRSDSGGSTGLAGGSAGSFGCGCCSVSFSILVTQSVTIDGLLMLLPIACAHFVGTPLNSPAAQHGAPTCAGWSDSVLFSERSRATRLHYHVEST